MSERVIHCLICPFVRYDKKVKSMPACGAISTSIKDSPIGVILRENGAMRPVIVNPAQKPSFCPLPILLQWEAPSSVG